MLDELNMDGQAQSYISPPAITMPLSQDTPARPMISSKSLYVSHFLSTWNSRGFEFGAILFLATIYPGTLLSMSIYALIRAAAAILFAHILGRYIDTTERLRVIQVSIVGQRLAVVLSCLAFLFLLSAYGEQASRLWKNLVFVGLLFLACIEKLCSVMNTVAVERDWVVVIADEQEDALQEMNSQMRRIDLFCKLISPLAIALLDGLSSVVAVLVTMGINASFVGLEYFLIARVYRKTPALAQRYSVHARDEVEIVTLTEGTNSIATEPLKDDSIIAALRCYVESPAFLASLSLSILYLTVLSFSGQMTTFLLAVPEPKMTSTTVGLLRTISTVFELSSTFIAPRLMSFMGPVRAGIWCLSWQTLCLTSGVGLLWTSHDLASRVGVIALVVSVVLSRVGLWSFDQVAQLHIQNNISASSRGSFSSVEASLQNFFELLTFASTIVWSRPEEFRYPASVSLVATYVAAACYAKFVRDRRGHLLHMPGCLKGSFKGAARYTALHNRASDPRASEDQEL